MLLNSNIQYSFTNETMQEILAILKKFFSEKNQTTITFEVLNPDICDGCYAGKEIIVENQKYIYRGYKSWIDLAEILYCKTLTPKIYQQHTILLTFKKLKLQSSFHTETNSLENNNKNEKYGVNSQFSQICKNEEPAFLEYYLRALKNVSVCKRIKILNLGINSGDEFEVIQKICSNSNELEFVGIDISHSAIEEARKKFPTNNFTFYSHNINRLDELHLGEFDLIISIGTLQSSGINFKLLFNSLVQKYLKKDGAMILGFPNCRWIDGEMIYGAKAPNYNFSEMTLLFNPNFAIEKS